MEPPDLDQAEVLADLSDAEGHVNSICFKTGPPKLNGVELEWTVHDAVDPARPVDLDRLRTALGRHAPTTLDPTSPAVPLPHRGLVSVEPGGQVELSTAPQPSLAGLFDATDADIRRLGELLHPAGLVLGASGIDSHRPARPVVDTPRYRAMRCAFDRDGDAGRTMMYSTAGLQVCLDAGEPTQVARRWAALHALGPVLVATFATAGRHAGRDTGWASARMAAWLSIDPARTAPVWRPGGIGDPVQAWTRYALAAPLLCVRRDGDDWTVPPGVTFADWLDGALPRRPTVADLDYHLTTLFPPVRPRGYLEVRYLDAQPPGEWIAPAGVLAALLGHPPALDAAVDACGPVLDRWESAARRGLADPALARAASAVLDHAQRALEHAGLPPATCKEISQIVERRLTVAERGTP